VDEKGVDECNWYCSLVGKGSLKLKNMEESEEEAVSIIISVLKEPLQLCWP